MNRNQNEIQLNLNLFQAGIVAIPLKHQEESKLNPQPNFLIVDNTFDRIRQDFPDGKGGVNKDVACRNTALRLVYRNIVTISENNYYLEELEYNVNGGKGMFNQIIPKVLADVVDEGHQECIEFENIINTFLPMLRFRGYLSDFKMEYDVEKSKEYLALLEEARKPIPVPQPIPMPVIEPMPEPTPTPEPTTEEPTTEEVETPNE